MDEAAAPQSDGRKFNEFSQTFVAIFGILVAVTGIATMLVTSSASAPLQESEARGTPYRVSGAARSTGEGNHLVERDAVAFTTQVGTATPVVTPTVPTATPIPWTVEDINALTWLCYEEVRGMKEARIDACLSVIATVRQRYAYSNAFGEGSIEETLLRDNQFPITFHTDRPAPDAELRRAVENYRWGARGSCTGYLFYDSVPGGPSLCVISASNGQFVEFHRGWR